MAKRTQEPAKRGRGRPPKPDAERKRGVLAMRVRDNIREALATRAAANQRSMSEEAEYLLERAMQTQGPSLGEALDLAFDSEAAGVALVLAQVAHMVGGNSGAEEWLSSPYAFAQVTEGVTEVLEAMRPQGDVTEPHHRPVLCWLKPDRDFRAVRHARAWSREWGFARGR